MKGIAYLACRIFAIYWFIVGLTNLSGVIGGSLALWEMMKKGDVAAVTPNAIFYNIIPFVVYMVVAVVLWWKADRLSDSLIPNQSEVMQDARWDYHAIQTLIFSGIGLYALVDSLPGLGRALYRRHLLAAQTTIHLPVNLDERAFLFQASLEVVLGVGMLLGARGLSQTLLWIRELGLRSKG